MYTGHGPGDQPVPVVVMGGSHSALAVIRSLGRAGVPVFFITDDHPQPGLSRYVSKNLRWSAADAPDRVLELIQFALEHDFAGAVLIPCSDTEVRFVAENHDQLRLAFRLITLPWPALFEVVDKCRLAELAARAGVDSPLLPMQADRRDIVFPVVIKPTRRDVSNALTRAKAWRVDDAADLSQRLAEAVSLMGPDGVIVQEMVPGGGEAQFSYAALCNHGTVVAGFAARRARQYPIDFGFTSSFVEVVENDAVEAAAKRLIATSELHGIAEIEFKYDRRDGRYKLLDVNPRPWAWVGLGAAAGVDFPVLAYRMALGGTIEPKHAQASGASWLLASRDIVAGFQAWRRGLLSLAGYARSLRRVPVFAVLAADDPVPFLWGGPILAKRLTRRWLRKIGLLESAPVPAAEIATPLQAFNAAEKPARHFPPEIAA